MCGRYTLTALFDDIIAFFQLAPDACPLLEPRYNIAPTQPVVAILETAARKRKPEFMLWGLIPSWSKDANSGAKLINARAETLAEKPSFRSAFKRRRCLIPASGFYEWQTVQKKKQPFLIRPRDEKLFAFAGLWEDWNGPNGEALRSCAIVTTQANALMQPFHDRMPVILRQQDFAAWLNPADENSAELEPLLVPFPPTAMHAIPVSNFVNAVKNEGPKCLEPVQHDLDLFCE